MSWTVALVNNTEYTVVAINGSFVAASMSSDWMGSGVVLGAM